MQTIGDTEGGPFLLGTCTKALSRLYLAYIMLWLHQRSAPMGSGYRHAHLLSRFLLQVDYHSIPQENKVAQASIEEKSYCDTVRYHLT